MKYKSSDVCRCGHTKEFHTLRYVGTKSACAKILRIDENQYIEWCQCHRFVLDNLYYIERLAKERKLI
jgi:hypothetical protein